MALIQKQDGKPLRRSFPGISGGHQPAACVDTVHPALSRHRCWDRGGYCGRSNKPDDHIGYRPTKLKGNAQQAAEKSISSEIATLSD
jgi:hypothetical protein